jgi:hypothetical protein
MAIDHQPVTSSDIKSADAVISAIGGYLHGVWLISDATNVASVIIYDNATTNSGVVLAKLSIPASTTAPQFITFDNPVSANKGIYADVTGTGANYIVYFSQGI